MEDVERGYITTKARLSPPPAPKNPTRSPTQFGFVPVKTAANYVRTEPKVAYAQPEYTAGYQGRSQYDTIAYSAPQQYSPSSASSQQYSPSLQQYSPSSQQYSPLSQYSSGAQQYTTGIQYASKQQAQAPAPPQLQPQPQAQAYYVPQGQQGHYLNNYDNLQYISNNNIDQGSQQQFNAQQYYYLQQYQSPSTAIQAVVDPKGELTKH